MTDRGVPMADPIDAYLQMAEMKNRNRRQMYGDMAGIGQGLGETFGSIGQMIGDQKKKALMQQIMQQMKNQQTPIAAGGPAGAGTGIPGYVPPNQGPNSTAVPTGQTPPPNPQKLMGLMTQYNPEMGMKAMIDQQDPYKKALVGLYKSEEEKNRRPPKPQNEWALIPGVLSKSGKPLFYDKTNHQVVEGPIEAKSTGFGSTMGPIRQRQYTMQDLPSNQPPTTSGGAAYQVKLGARQGKALIGKPGSPQRTGAARADLVRAITRVAPTDEGLKNVNFSSNIAQRWSELKQQLTVDPSAVDNPKIRKEMYDIFDDMEKSSEPFIKNQLDEMEDQGFNITPMTRKRQLGENIPNIPFVEGGDGGGSASQLPPVGATFQGGKVLKVERIN
jgi:hypothetical protein